MFIRGDAAHLRLVSLATTNFIGPNSTSTFILFIFLFFIFIFFLLPHLSPFRIYFKDIFFLLKIVWFRYLLFLSIMQTSCKPIIKSKAVDEVILLLICE